MDKKEYYEQCEKCGRPFPPATPKCNYTCGPCSEYCGYATGCIKKDVDPCKSCCVIPSVTVENTDGLTNLRNCLVHVTSTNTTFYVDDKHRPMITWAGPVETTVPSDVTTDEQFLAFVKSFNLRSQYLYAKYHSSDTDQDGIVAIYFDKTGEIFWAGEYNEMTEEPVI